MTRGQAPASTGGPLHAHRQTEAESLQQIADGKVAVARVSTSNLGPIARAFAAAVRKAYPGESTPAMALDEEALGIETAPSATPSVHLDAPGAPQAALPNPTGPQVTTPYATLLDAWD